jgi:hypothetical protein
MDLNNHCLMILPLKLKLANPSFDDQSGVPTLSGPIAALGILGMRDFIKYCWL